MVQVVKHKCPLSYLPLPSLVQEKLRGIRNNVVSLLSALLPQVDLAGVSVDSSDVDNILQQIIEVNSL